MFVQQGIRTKHGDESTFYVKDMDMEWYGSFCYLMLNMCYTIILWVSTLSTILKHSKSRNKSLHAKMNQFSTICPPNVGWNHSSLLQGVNVHGLFLEGAGWEDGKGEDEAPGKGAAGAVGWSLTVGEGTFLSREICHVITRRVWDHMNPHPLETLHHVLKCFKTRETKSRIRSYHGRFFAKPLYALDVTPHPGLQWVNKG